MESWKRVKDTGFEDKYEVSATGKIRNVKTGKILQPNFDDEGYGRAVLFDINMMPKRHTKKVHRVVAEAFIENPLNLPIVNHKDGDKTNNNIQNLEWVSHSRNNLHRHNLAASQDRILFRVGLIEKKIWQLQKRKTELLAASSLGPAKRRYKRSSEN